MTSAGALIFLLIIVGGVLGLCLTFAPAKRKGSELTVWRRLLGVVLVMCAVGAIFLLVAGAGLASVANH
ncbi:MAG TPA: hypothetical protein VGM90_04630 [Kofleriaceae bacterium]|jgi:hypothetical protein